MYKLQLRRCRSCGYTATTESELEYFTKDKRLPHGRVNFCKDCSRKYKKKLRQTHLDMIKEITGLECESCGFTHTTTAPFDYHHLDPTEKESDISSMVGNAKFDKILKEISKCVFLCKNCHYIEHERLREENQ